LEEIFGARSIGQNTALAPSPIGWHAAALKNANNNACGAEASRGRTSLSVLQIAQFVGLLRAADALYWIRTLPTGVTVRHRHVVSHRGAHAVAGSLRATGVRGPGRNLNCEGGETLALRLNAQSCWTRGLQSGPMRRTFHPLRARSIREGCDGSVQGTARR
jgi:hypothetical protein